MKLSKELLEFATFHLGSIRKVEAQGWKRLETGVGTRDRTGESVSKES